MIQCPTCAHQEFVGTLYCSECGTRLVHVSAAPGTTISVRKDQYRLGQEATKPAAPDGIELETGALLGVRLIPSGQVISLVGRDNYTLGRVGENQAVVPDVNLTPFGAYDAGVSRIHAELRVREDGIYVVDLDSANGTYVNGHRLEPQVPHRVGHGDILQLGQLRLQIISRYRARG